jgi:hypothetical protein
LYTRSKHSTSGEPLRGLSQDLPGPRIERDRFPRAAGAELRNPRLNKGRRLAQPSPAPGVSKGCCRLP